MPLFKGSTRRTVRELAAQVEELTYQLESARATNRKLAQKLLATAKVSPEAVQKAIEATVIQMPDGRFVAPASLDWDGASWDD